MTKGQEKTPDQNVCPHDGAPLDVIESKTRDDWVSEELKCPKCGHTWHVVGNKITGEGGGWEYDEKGEPVKEFMFAPNWDKMKARKGGDSGKE